jgi:hypothetical protein
MAVSFRERVDAISAALQQLTSTIDSVPPAQPRGSGWSADDVLRHATFWHRYYARNLAAEARGAVPRLLDGTYPALNREGVASLQSSSRDDLKAMLARAQAGLARSVLSGAVMQMTYRKGAEPYPLARFLQMVESHLKGHTRDLRRRAGLGRRGREKEADR